MSDPEERLELRPIAHVRSAVLEPEDDRWGGVPCVLELAAHLPTEALRGLEAFSHLEIVFAFRLIDPQTVCRGARRPRHRAAWPEVGILAQRARRRPNRLGVSRCRLVRVEGRRVHVLDLDAVDGTPILDIKPWMRETAPIGPVAQPRWSEELMARYYEPGRAGESE